MQNAFNAQPVELVDAGMSHGNVDSYGALVGWKAEDLHDRIVLRMQFVHKPPPHSRDDVHHSVLVIDKNQAVQLGNYLFEITGQTKPASRPSWFGRLIGK